MCRRLSTSLATSALLLFAASSCSSSSGGVIRTFTANSRGVAFTVEVNGVASELLSSSTTGSMVVALPVNRAEFKVKPGANTLTIKVREVDAGQEPFLAVELRENKPGETVDTSASGPPNPPFPIRLEGEKLKAGGTATYAFSMK
jgi:hypothetical protein